MRLRLAHDRSEDRAAGLVGVAASMQIAVPDDRLQGAVDLGRDRQRQLRHRLHRPVLAERHLQLLRDPRDGEDLGDRLERVDVRAGRTRSGCLDTTLIVPTARPFETSGTGART